MLGRDAFSGGFVYMFTLLVLGGTLVEKDAVSYVQLSTNGYVASIITDNLP